MDAEGYTTQPSWGFDPPNKEDRPATEIVITSI